MQIPTIDLAPARGGDPAERRRVARQIGEACTEIGFFTVRGHGIPSTLIEATQEAGRSFFDQPLAEKNGYGGHRPRSTAAGGRSRVRRWPARLAT